jgi:hypothetical protein
LSSARALGYGLFYYGVKHVTAAAASIANLAEPLTAMVLAIVLYGERPGPLGWVGAALLIGVLVFLYRGGGDQAAPIGSQGDRTQARVAPLPLSGIPKHQLPIPVHRLTGECGQDDTAGLLHCASGTSPITCGSASWRSPDLS